MNECSERMLNRALYDLTGVCANLKDSLNDEDKKLVWMYQDENMQDFQKERAYTKETIRLLNLAIAHVGASLPCIKILKNREEKAHE